MAERKILTVQTVVACGYPTLPLTANSADFVFTAAGADYAAGMGFTHTGREIILVHNANVGTQKITVVSVPDDKKRTGDITEYSMAAGEYAVFGPFPIEGWRQTSGLLHLLASATDVEVAVLRLPQVA